jgi:hypothetical protein
MRLKGTPLDLATRISEYSKHHIKHNYFFAVCQKKHGDSGQAAFIQNSEKSPLSRTEGCVKEGFSVQRVKEPLA